MSDTKTHAFLPYADVSVPIKYCDTIARNNALTSGRSLASVLYSA